MTEFEKWLKKNKNLCKTDATLALLYRGKHFPKALRMLEVLVKMLEIAKIQGSPKTIKVFIDNALAQINEIAKEQE